jgi:hypothetical protein
MSKQWVLEKSKGIEGLTLEDVPVPEVGERDVLVKLHAVSLNYRDVMIATVRRTYRHWELSRGLILTNYAGHLYLALERPYRPLVRPPPPSSLLPNRPN